jgi:cation diffusion facilitator CzcD-associated flavoprotein CzcO
MNGSPPPSRDGNADPGAVERFDAIIIGAGVSGLYQLHRLRELGLRVRVFETGSGVGGTWYWNRYPGARFDSESYTYAYSFSQELLAEWDWQERFAGQPETERYLNYVADKFDLRPDIQFNSRIDAAHYREATCSWNVVLEDGSHYETRFLITAIGVLSAPTMPRIPGVETFRGQSCHTHYWPKDGVNFAGKRVGVIGTGATAVQAITEMAKTVGRLTVFQRTPIGARRCTTRRSARTRCAGSAPATPKSSRAATRAPAASSTSPTRAAPSR